MADTSDPDEARYRVLFERSPVAMALFTDDGVFFEVNEAAASLLGRSRQDLVESAWEDIVHPDERALARAARERIIADGARTHRVERRVVRPDGREVLLLATTVRINSTDDQPGCLSTFEDVTAVRGIEAQLMHAATHDTLTGLPNRRLLLDQLARTLARSVQDGRDVTVLFLDLDRVKRVNTSLGHEAGDGLLVAVASNLAEAVRDSDFVARLSGDEFVVVCEGVRDSSEVDILAERLLEAIATPIELAGQKVVITASLGIVTPDNAAVDPRDLLRLADAAMSHAKQSGRSRWSRGPDSEGPAPGTGGASQISVEAELRHALHVGELTLHYQPVVRRDGALVGFEALVRWAHPIRGLLAPDAFLGVADQGALVRDLTSWVVRRAVQDADGWARAAPTARRVWVSVNVPADELRRPEFGDLLLDVLRTHHCPPSAVRLEVLETQLADSAPVLAAIERLVDAGIGLVVDDFGTGYSTLSYLKRLPASTIKIDQSFVRNLCEDPADLSIVRAIVEACRATKRQCVAEGVETPGQLAALRVLGVDALQGDLLGAASPIEEHAALLASRHLDLDALGSGAAQP